ncbi:MAG: hypothetical protein VKK62_01795 [Synechococcaceae cyanobacterium]|nr:hypothetical protein [Synechococcaceae cyanobacterium]
MSSDPIGSEASAPLVWDWYRLDHTLGNVSSGPTEGQDDLQGRVTELEGRVDRLLLLFDAMRELMQQLGLFTEAELIARAQEIDLRDGFADGRHTLEKQRLICSRCQRQLSRRASRCFYCGCSELTPG